MRKLQRLCIALVLTLAFAAGAFGGIIDCPPAPAPAPPPSADATGIIGTVPGDTQPAAAPTDPVVSIALGLLQNVLLVF